MAFNIFYYEVPGYLNTFYLYFRMPYSFDIICPIISYVYVVYKPTFYKSIISATVEGIKATEQNRMAKSATIRKKERTDTNVVFERVGFN